MGVNNNRQCLHRSVVVLGSVSFFVPPHGSSRSRL